jgi:maltooligosyltrehalose trehalohydrolase
MERDRWGYYHVTTSAQPGARYFYRLDGETERPDPASRFQPFDVHQASEIARSEFEWTDQGWPGLLLDDYLFYELHVGTFTPEGTFDALIPHLDRLVDLGITAVEIMPIGQFPGTRNWGYDGVYSYAAQNSYGGPEGFKRLVDACHTRGLAVVLDVVYNHMGPEGNYLSQFGPYFTDRYKTPWGDALNFDGPQSDHVRHFFIENALYWIVDCHVDALRLDATHAMYDFSAETFLEELVQTVHQTAQRLNRRVYLIAESERADDRLLRSPDVGGIGMDAQWSDELHHVLHTLLTDEDFAYYLDFGDFSQLDEAFRQGFVYSRRYSPFHERRHGTFSNDLPATKFVVCSQNHDQVGNRMHGDRLTALVSLDELKLAAGIVLLSPFLPLLFMGEEYGEPAPFLFFTSFPDPGLGAAVTKGRRAEFAAYRWEGEAPDPQAEETFLRSRLNHNLRDQDEHRALWNLYKELIRLRKTHPALRRLSKEQMEVIGYDRERVLFAHRWDGDSAVVMAFNFADQSVTLTLPIPVGCWNKLLESVSNSVLPTRIEEQGSATLTLPPNAFVVYEGEVRGE